MLKFTGCTALVFVALVLSTGPAASQLLTVETDKDVYTIHETVQIRIHNPTQEPVWFMQLPVLYIEFVATGLCVVECWGIAIMTDLGPGESRDITYTAFEILLATGSLGTFRIIVWEDGTGDLPLPPPPQTEFTLVPATPNETLAWSAVKKLFR